jgi:hypothetical protein
MLLPVVRILYFLPVPRDLRYRLEKIALWSDQDTFCYRNAIDGRQSPYLILRKREGALVELSKHPRQGFEPLQIDSY